MPKTTNTRKQKAVELYKRLKRGPCLSDIGSRGKGPQDYERDYQNWASSWVLTEVRALIPELRGMSDAQLEQIKTTY